MTFSRPHHHCSVSFQWDRGASGDCLCAHFIFLNSCVRLLHITGITSLSLANIKSLLFLSIKQYKVKQNYGDIISFLLKKIIYIVCKSGFVFICMGMLIHGTHVNVRGGGSVLLPCGS